MALLASLLAPLLALVSDRSAQPRKGPERDPVPPVVVGRLFAEANGMRFLLLDDAEALSRVSAWVGPMPRGALQGKPRVLAVVDDGGLFVAALVGEMSQGVSPFQVDGFLRPLPESSQPTSSVDPSRVVDSIRALESEGRLAFSYPGTRVYAMQKLGVRR